MKISWVGLVCLGLVGVGEAGVLRLKSGEVNTSAAAVKSSSSASLSAAQQETPDGKICQLVQFKASPGEEDRERVEAIGGEIVGVVPDRALLVLIDAADRDRPGTLPGVEWSGPCRPEYKLSSELDFSQAELEVKISLFKPQFVQRIELWVEQRQGSVEDSGRGATRGSVRATLPASAVEELSTLAEVEWVEPFVPAELSSNVAVEAPRLNVKTVWETHGLTGKGQVVAVADSGLDVGDASTIHPDFAGRIRYAHSWVFGDDWKDYGGHGTHVAGLVLGDGSAYSNGLYRGVAYEAELVMQAIGENDGSTSVSPPSSLGLLFNEAYTNGARIQQNSWGSRGIGEYTAECRDLDEFVWGHDDMLILFAAGNAGSDRDGDGVTDLYCLDAPAAAKNCLTVGAAESDRPAGSGGFSSHDYVQHLITAVFPIAEDLLSTPWDGVHQGMAAFSSRGPCQDGRIKPDVVAPGTDIISCRSRVDGASTMWGALEGEAGDYYLFSGGTSMATPLVSGVAALTRQYFQETHSVTNPSAALVKAAIINGAISLYPGQYGTNEYLEIPNTTGNPVEGWGQVNAGNTFFPEGKENIFWDRKRLQTGDEHVIELNVADTNGISVTLVWSDPPASLLSSHQLVNDLDLMLISPSGITNRPNGLSGADHTNNVEQIDLALCETGRWTMVVSGTEVPQGPQPYALFSSFAGDAKPAFEVTSVWHEPETVLGTDESVELFASLTSGDKSLAVASMVWRADGGDWHYEPLTLVGTNGEDRVYSAPIDVGGVGGMVEYYAYAFSYDMELVMSPTNRFAVNSPMVYVALDGSQTWPYDSLETAYTNLNRAVDDAATLGTLEIRVADGFYEPKPLEVYNGMILSSLNGPESAVLDFSVQTNWAVLLSGGRVSGFTVQGGDSSQEHYAGGVTVYSGVLSNCWVRGNAALKYGGGIRLYDGLVTDCRVENNSSEYGGGFVIQNGVVRNSIVAGNESGDAGGGGVLWGGAVQNCTFVDNYSDGIAGGIGIGGPGLIDSCIVVSNSAAMAGDNWHEQAPMDMRYSCTAPLPDGIGNMDFDPLFVDAAVGDYHLKSTYGHFTTNGWVADSVDSPCIDFGNPLSDASRERSAGRINMGAYGNTAEASLSGANETRLIVQSAAGTTDPSAGMYLYSQGDAAIVALVEDPFTVGATQYQFSAWSLDDGLSLSSSTNSSLSLSMTSNWIVRAEHDTYYRMDVYAGENGAVDFSNGWYAAGSSLSATAEPDLYYAFDGWSGDAAATNNPLAVQLDQPVELAAEFAPAYTDSGVPQLWLGQHGITNDFEAASVADPDGDGAQTWEEYVAGTLPLDSNSVLTLRLDLQPGANAVSWDAQANRFYTLYSGSNLVDGVTNVLVQYYSMFPMALELPDTVHADDPAVFYRIEVGLEGD